MPTNTTTYSFQKPTVSGDADAWGGYLNANWDKTDDLFDGTTPVTGIDINSGSIDGTAIGANSATTGAFTTVTVTGDILTVSNADLDLAPNGTGKVVVRGNTNSAKIVLNCENNSHGVTVASPPHSASATYEVALPNALGTVNASAIVTADANGDVLFPDNEKLKMGTGGDLEVYHDSTHSIIKDAGTGDLWIAGDNALNVTTADFTEYKARFVKDESVYLYYDNSEKFKTSATGVDITGVALTDGVTVDGTLDIEEVYEKVTTQTSTTGTVTFDTTAQAVEFYTANQTANRTINFSNVNANLAIGQSVTAAILMTQGSSAYYLNVYQIDGSAVTPKWANDAAPSGGNASGIDSYTFTIIKTADATFTVLASQTQYK